MNARFTPLNCVVGVLFGGRMFACFFLRQDHPDGGVYVKDLTIMIVKGVRDLQQVMEVPKSDMVLNT